MGYHSEAFIGIDTAKLRNAVPEALIDNIERSARARRLSVSAFCELVLSVWLHDYHLLAEE